MRRLRALAPLLLVALVLAAAHPPYAAGSLPRALLGLFALLATGAAVLALLVRDPGALDPFARAGTAFGLGLVVLPLLLLLASLLGVAPTPGVGSALAALCVVAALVAGPQRLRGLVRPARRAASHAVDPRRRALEVALGLAILWLGSLAAAVALAEPLAEWDVLAIWAYKAKLVLHEPIAGSAAFGDLGHAYSHLDYPLLWPFAIAWIWSAAGAADVFVAKLLAPALLAASLATLYGLLLRRNDRTTALLFTALFAGLPMALGQVARLMADPPTGYLALLTGASAYLWLEEDAPDALRIAGVAGAGLVLVKNEGALLLLVIGAALIAAAFLRGGVRRAGRAALWLPGVPLLLASPWLALRLGLPGLHSSGASALGDLDPSRILERLPEVSALAVRHALETRDWLFFWPVAAVLLALGVRHGLRGPALFLFAIVHLPILAYLGVFAASPWPPGTLMEGGFSRLLLHVLPLEVFLLAELSRRAGLLPWRHGEGEAAALASPSPAIGSPSA